MTLTYYHILSCYAKPIRKRVSMITNLSNLALCLVSKKLSDNHTFA